MIESKEAQRFATEWIDALNRRDLDRLLTRYQDNVEWVSPFIERILGKSSCTLRGKRAVRSYLERSLERSPKLRLKLDQVFGGAHSVTLCYRSQNLIAANVEEFGRGGRVRRVLCHYTR